MKDKHGKSFYTVGTNHFVDRKSVFKYYLSQEWDEQAIQDLLDNKEALVGPPINVHPSTLIINDEGRYLIAQYRK